MSKHIEALLTAAGLPAEDVQKIVALPEAEQATFDTKPLVEKINSHYSTIHQNDPAFFNSVTIEKLPPQIKKQIESEQFGRASSIVRDKFIKGLGMTEAEFEDLPEDQRKQIEKLIPVAIERWTKTKSGSKETQEQLIEARKQLEKYGPNYEKEVETKYEAKANERVNSVLFNAAVIGELSSIQGLKISASDIAKTANDILSSKYAFERVGDYGIELRQKDNPQMKVLKGSSSQQLTLKEALSEIAIERGWVEPEKADDKIFRGKVEPGKNGQQKLTVIPAHIQDRIAKKIASEK